MLWKAGGQCPEKGGRELGLQRPLPASGTADKQTRTSFPVDTGESEERPCSSGMPVAPPPCPPAFLLRMQGLLSLARFLDTRSLAQGKEGAITAVPSTLTHTQMLGFSLPLPSGQHPWAP